MNKKQRILFFAIGVILGVMMVANILGERASKKRASDLAAERRLLPGLLLTRAREGRGVYAENGRGVLEERTERDVGGFAQVRRVLVGGRNRFDALNNPEPPEYIAITESYATAAPLTPDTPTARVEFAYADRLRVTVREPADTAGVWRLLAPLGARLHPEPGSRTVVTARFAAPKLATTGEALALLAGRPEVVSAERVSIDWTKEVAPE